LFDTAELYNNEALLGKAIVKSDVAREEIFIISKLDDEVRCAFFDRNLHSRMPLVPTPARLMRACV
jgi:aryl-alcohol dehydrogenase-like predicted oxidoreductase